MTANDVQTTCATLEGRGVSSPPRKPTGDGYV